VCVCVCERERGGERERERTDSARLNVVAVTPLLVQQARAVRSFKYVYVSRNVLSVSTVIPLPVRLFCLFLYLLVTQGRDVTWLGFVFSRKST
jgi:hypothetical protein